MNRVNALALLIILGTLGLTAGFRQFEENEKKRRNVFGYRPKPPYELDHSLIETGDQVM